MSRHDRDRERIRFDDHKEKKLSSSGRSSRGPTRSSRDRDLQLVQPSRSAVRARLDEFQLTSTSPVPLMGLHFKGSSANDTRKYDDWPGQSSSSSRNSMQYSTGAGYNYLPDKWWEQYSHGRSNNTSSRTSSNFVPSLLGETTSSSYRNYGSMPYGDTETEKLERRIQEIQRELTLLDRADKEDTASSSINRKLREKEEELMRRERELEMKERRLERRFDSRRSRSKSAERLWRTRRSPERFIMDYSGNMTKTIKVPKPLMSLGRRSRTRSPRRRSRSREETRNRKYEGRLHLKRKWVDSKDEKRDRERRKNKEGSVTDKKNANLKNLEEAISDESDGEKKTEKTEKQIEEDNLLREKIEEQKKLWRIELEKKKLEYEEKQKQRKRELSPGEMSPISDDDEEDCGNMKKFMKENPEMFKRMKIGESLKEHLEKIAALDKDEKINLKVEEKIEESGDKISSGHTTSVEQSPQIEMISDDEICEKDDREEKDKALDEILVEDSEDELMLEAVDDVDGQKKVEEDVDVKKESDKGEDDLAGRQEMDKNRSSVPKEEILEQAEEVAVKNEVKEEAVDAKDSAAEVLANQESGVVKDEVSMTEQADVVVTID